MKAFLIDPAEQTIQAVELERAEGRGLLPAMYAALDCQLVDRIADGVIPGHDIWIDDEGLLHDEPPHGIFVIPATYQQLFHGRALVTGVDLEEGETTAAFCTAEEIARKIFAVRDLTPEHIICQPLRIVEAQNA